MSNVEQDVVALKEKLLCLLLKHEGLFFLGVDCTLPTVDSALHALKLSLQQSIPIGLFLDLCLQIGEICDYLVAQLLAILHFLLELFVLKGAASCFLVQGLPCLAQDQVQLLTCLVQFALSV